jgi:hypothetical protein
VIDGSAPVAPSQDGAVWGLRARAGRRPPAAAAAVADGATAAGGGERRPRESVRARAAGDISLPPPRLTPEGRSSSNAPQTARAEQSPNVRQKNGPAAFPPTAPTLTLPLPLHPTAPLTTPTPTGKKPSQDEERRG